MTDNPIADAADAERYLAACHAMQSGVAVEMSRGSHDTEPKHLRVGVNTAHVAVAAVVRLLIGKGIITVDEYTRANADEMENEVKQYEQRNGVNLA